MMISIIQKPPDEKKTVGYKANLINSQFLLWDRVLRHLVHYAPGGGGGEGYSDNGDGGDGDHVVVVIVLMMVIVENGGCETGDGHGDGHSGGGVMFMIWSWF